MTRYAPIYAHQIADALELEQSALREVRKLCTDSPATTVVPSTCREIRRALDGTRIGYDMPSDDPAVQRLCYWAPSATAVTFWGSPGSGPTDIVHIDHIGAAENLIAMIARGESAFIDLHNVIHGAVDDEHGPLLEKCEVCGRYIDDERQIVAESRGQIAKYCSTTCRETAAKRRYRADKSQ
jgi:hypothetical protein